MQVPFVGQTITNMQDRVCIESMIALDCFKYRMSFKIITGHCYQKGCKCNIDICFIQHIKITLAFEASVNV